MGLFGKTTRARRAVGDKNRSRLAVEALESRLTPYSVSGNAWPRPDLITLGFVPDGTIVGYNGTTPITSNLQSSFNTRFGSAPVWQNEILRAAQAWAQQTNINFKVVTDNGAEAGTGDYQQGDGGMADIRIGGYNFGSTTLAQAYMPAPVNNTSYAGDIQFNTGQTWNLGTQYDLYTVAVHEIGHALGLYHSAIINASMNGSYNGIRTTLDADDIAGIRAVTGYNAGDFSSPGYLGARLNDLYDVVSNGTSAAASNVTSAINTTTKTALVQNLNITTTADIDYYKFTVPTGLGGTLTVKAQSDGLSLLAPTLTLYNSSQTQLATQSASATDYDGGTLSLTYAVTAGQTYYVKVTGLNTTASSTGNYALALGFVGVAAPTAASPNTATANGLDVSAGGGQATKIAYEMAVNTNTAGTQETSTDTRQAVAMNVSGNYVVVWSSDGQDGSGYGVYAQRYNSNGVKLGSEFRVNTTTIGDQQYPAVAMNDSGNFVVVWASNGQDGSSWGVYGQRYNSNGVAVGGEFLVNTTTYRNQTNPVVALNASGDFLVAWESLGQDNGGSWGIYAKRFTWNLVTTVAEFNVNTFTADDQQQPAVALDDLGNMVISWASHNQNETGWGVYARRYNAVGTALGTEFRVNTTAKDDQMYPSVAVAPLGEFVVTWSGLNQDGGGWGVYAQRYNATGLAQGGEFQVNTATANDQMYSSVAMDNAANFVITWSSLGQDASNSWGIRGQQFLANGAPAGGELAINTTTAGDQLGASVAIASTGDAVVVWSGSGAVDTAGIFSQMYRLSNGSGLSALGERGVPHEFGPEHHDHQHDHEHDTGVVARRGGYPNLRLPADNLHDFVGLLQKRQSRAPVDRDVTAP